MLHPDLDEQGRTDVIERVKAGCQPVIVKLKKDHWGQRKLAYPINKNQRWLLCSAFGRNGHIRSEGNGRNILYTEQILRHLVIRKDE